VATYFPHGHQSALSIAMQRLVDLISMVNTTTTDRPTDVAAIAPQGVALLASLPLAKTLPTTSDLVLHFIEHTVLQLVTE
jgi:hypothetical protein